MGHQSKLNPFQYRPTYRDELAHLPLAGAGAPPARPGGAGADPRRGARLQRPLPHGPDRPPRARRRVPLGDPLEYEPHPETQHPRHREAAAASTRGRSPTTCCSRPTATSCCCGRSSTTATSSYDGLLDMMEDPISVHGLGDGGAHVGLVCDASMTTYMLTPLGARPAPAAVGWPLEHAVRRLTRDTGRAVRARRPGRARARDARPTST